jgi:DNA ligase (NAD+)
MSKAKIGSPDSYRQSMAGQIEELRRTIHRHDQLYYDQARPEIDDREYDELFRRLRELEEAHPDLITPDSPTQRVAGQPVEGFASVRHAIAMISIDNTYTEGELLAFDARVRKLLGGSDFSYVCEPKIDGVSLSVRYEDGRLALAATRGDGTSGDDVTANARTIRNIPLLLHAPAALDSAGREFPPSIPRVLEVRGETFLTRRRFVLINQRQEEAGEEPYANPRNTAAGTLKLLDPRLVAARQLHFLPHGQGVVEGFEFSSYQQWLAYLQALGFQLAPHVMPARDIQEAIEFLHRFAELRKRLPFDTDGVVVKVNSLSQRRALGSTARAPRWCIAFKYQPEQASTELANVVFQVGKTGTITPVAEFQPPVFVSGTQVYRASLHNFDEIRRKDIRRHDRVIVQKAGEVIPYVVGVVPEARPLHAQTIEPPSHCPACKGPVIRDGGFVRCTNVTCPAQLAQRLKYFGGRNQMDIENLGSAIIEQLINAKLVQSIPDLYRLKLEDLLPLERMGQKSAENLLAGIQQSKNRGWERLLAGLSILHVGTRTAAVLAERFPDLEALAAARLADFEAVPDVGEVVGQSIYNFLHHGPGLELLRELAELGIAVRRDVTGTAATTSGPLSGKTIVVTGELKKYTRGQIKEMIESLGGNVSESVGKKTSFVLSGANPGGKLHKAQKLGVEVIDEAEFFKRVGRG